MQQRVTRRCHKAEAPAIARPSLLIWRETPAGLTPNAVAHSLLGRTTPKSFAIGSLAGFTSKSFGISNNAGSGSSLLIATSSRFTSLPARRSRESSRRSGCAHRNTSGEEGRSPPDATSGPPGFPHISTGTTIQAPPENLSGLLNFPYPLGPTRLFLAVTISLCHSACNRLGSSCRSPSFPFSQLPRALAGPPSVGALVAKCFRNPHLRSTEGLP
jgi:hypothetical protein